MPPPQMSQSSIATARVGCTSRCRASAGPDSSFVHRIDLVHHKDRAGSPLIAAVREVATTVAARLAARPRR